MNQVLYDILLSIGIYRKFFKKKILPYLLYTLKKEDIKMKKKKREFWYKDENGNNYINDRGIFASPEIENGRKNESDYEQWKYLIRYAMGAGYPDYIFCTPYLSASDMRTIIKYGYEEEDLRQYKIPNGIEVWKLSRSGLTFGQLRIALIALRFGLVLLDKIKELHKCSEEVLWWVTFAHRTCNANVCNWLNKGLSDEEIIKKIQKLYKKRGRKERMSDALTKLISTRSEARKGLS